MNLIYLRIRLTTFTSCQLHRRQIVFDFQNKIKVNGVSVESSISDKTQLNQDIGGTLVQVL